MNNVIAVDGPAASGKGTLARRLAKQYGFAHLDTGRLYRGVAFRVVQERADPEDGDTCARLAGLLTAATLDSPELRTEAVGRMASRVSALPAVRQALLDYQRRFALHPPGGARGAVLDGRDIGTVICPAAHAKLFVTASPETRAQRRALELRSRGEPVDYAEVLADIRRRDERDSGRSSAPLLAAPDATVLDTSDLDIEAAVAAARAIVETARARA